MVTQPKKPRRPKSDNVFTRENARAHYEERQDDKSADTGGEHEDPVEAKIKKAMAEGAFDNLPGKGKPLDLNKYLSVPEHLRPAYHVLKNAGYVPEEVRLKREMEILKEKISQCPSAREKASLVKELADISQQYYFCMDYNRQFK